MNKKTALSRVNPLFLKGICHRGLHTPQFSENGLNAFKNALDHHMALELDVHLTKDNQLIVFHDSNTKRMTGKEGTIEELTLAEIKSDYRLLDGEELPTLKEVFDLIQEQVPIVLELKVVEKNYKALAKRVMEELTCVKDKRNLMLISFDPRALFPFAGKGFIRQLLVAKSDEYTWPFRIFFEGVDLEHVFMSEKRCIKYAKKHFTNIWTVETQEVFDKCVPLVDTVTFQNMDPDYVKNYFQ